jgi:hypothetical protein
MDDGASRWPVYSLGASNDLWGSQRVIGGREQSTAATSSRTQPDRNCGDERGPTTCRASRLRAINAATLTIRRSSTPTSWFEHALASGISRKPRAARSNPVGYGRAVRPYTVCGNPDPGDDAWSTEPGDHLRDLERNDPEHRVESCEVVGVATDHGVIAVARADHDGCVNDVSGARMPTQGTGGTSFRLVEGYDGDRGEPEESGQASLASATAPRLCDHARWHSEIRTGGMCFVEQGLEAGITALDRDQRAGVERDASHSGQAERLTGPPAVFLGGWPGFCGHLGQQHGKLLVAAVFLDRVGHEGRDGCRAAICHRLAGGCD